MDNWIRVDQKGSSGNSEVFTNQLVETVNVTINNFESQKKNILSSVLNKRLMMLIYMLMEKVLMIKHNQSTC